MLEQYKIDDAEKFDRFRLSVIDVTHTIQIDELLKRKHICANGIITLSLYNKQYTCLISSAATQ